MMKIRDNLFHIGRQGGADIDHLVCQWMAEVERAACKACLFMRVRLPP